MKRLKYTKDTQNLERDQMLLMPMDTHMGKQRNKKETRKEIKNSGHSVCLLFHFSHPKKIFYQFVKFAKVLTLKLIIKFFQRTYSDNSEKA